jgi:hypothetical protein
MSAEEIWRSHKGYPPPADVAATDPKLGELIRLSFNVFEWRQYGNSTSGVTGN